MQTKRSTFFNGWVGYSLVMAGLMAFSVGFHMSNAPYTKGKMAAMEQEEEEEGKLNKRDQMDKAYEQEFRKTVDPALGEVPTERLMEAKNYADALRSNMPQAAIAGVDWTERGPSNVSGRTRAILVDPNTPSGLKVFSGSVAGGLWVTNDISASPPVWTPVDEFFGNLAVSTIVSDPSNPLVMYFGTGEGYFNLDAVRGLGIWKSTNGGTSWSQLAATNNSNFHYVYRMAVTSTGVVLAATSTGLRRSTDGGTTWAKVLGSGMGITGATSNRCYDVDIASNGDVYASLDGSVHKSTTGGATFAAAMTLPIAVGRVELACAPSDANYVYAVCENANVVAGFIRTTNGGTSWTSRTEPCDADPGVGCTDMSRGQAWYDLSIAVDPLNRDRLFTGGVDLFVSADGAGTWNQVSHWYGGFSEQYVHADQHIALYQPGSSSVVYFGNDGGIYRSTNANAANPTITFKGDNYNVTQFYACAIHPTAGTNYFLAGAQDNGSQQFNSLGIDATVEATGGDGAFCHIDQDQPQFQWTAYVYNDFYRSNDGGATWTNFSTGGGDFISPTDYDNVNNRMYMCNGNNNYTRWDNPQTGGTFVSVGVAGFGGYVTCVTVSPNTANRVFFGISNGDFFRVDNAHTGTPTATNISTGLPTGYCSNIEVEIGNDNHLLAVYSNYGINSIWESVNGGTSWTSVEGNLPDMPIRWALFNPNNTDQAMIATELGVWTTDNLNAGTTDWQPSNTGLANTRVDMLQMRTSDKLVIAATHGRGLYSSDAFANPTAEFSSDRRVQYLTRPIQFTDQSLAATSWAWDFGDGTTSTLEDPLKTYTAAGQYTVTLTINSGADTEVKTNYIQILPDLGTPYAPADGGNFEVNPLHFGPENWNGTPWQRGNSAVAGKNGTVSPSNAWVTGLVGNYVDNTTAELYCPNYNFTAAGTYTLRFQSKRNTEASYDGYRVEYTTNKGVTWTPLGTTTAAGWYNFANTVGDAAFPVNEAFFAGSATTYTLFSRDVSFLAGNPQVAFRFVFKSDAGVTAPGVAIDDFEILGPVNPAGLPVEGSPLAAQWRGSDVLLNWITYKEVQNKGFELQRSTDGIHFSPIGFVDGQGDASSQHDYTHLDAAPQGDRLWYRYRQVDLDGQSSLSNVVELSRSGFLHQVQVYPVPFGEELNVELASAPADFKVSLWDAQGRVMVEASGADIVAGKATLNTAALPSGVYFVVATSGGQRQVHKVVRM